MSYLSWFEQHANKHAQLMKKLKHLSDDEVIEYFRFENMIKNEPNFCPLYKDKTPCHSMENLNCYLCACPNFRFDDTAPKIKSHCGIDSKDGAIFEYEGIVHQDCSNCTVPHHEKYIKQHFHRDWKVIMSKVKPAQEKK